MQCTQDPIGFQFGTFALTECRQTINKQKKRILLIKHANNNIGIQFRSEATKSIEQPTDRPHCARI